MLKSLQMFNKCTTSSLRLILCVFKFKSGVTHWQKTVSSNQVLAQRWNMVKCKQHLLCTPEEEIQQ